MNTMKRFTSDLFDLLAWYVSALRIEAVILWRRVAQHVSSFSLDELITWACAIAMAIALCIPGAIWGRQ